VPSEGALRAECTARTAGIGRRWRPGLPTQWRRLLVLLLVLAGGAVIVATVGVPPVEEIRGWAQHAGWAGPLLLAALYAALSLTPAPIVVLSIGAGVLFGLPVGAGSVMVGAVAAAAIGFGLSRSLGRSTVEQFGGQRLARLDGLLRRRGLLAVIAVRLVPLVPFTALNYACGLTAVGTRDYLLGTALGIVPGVAAYVTIGAYGATPGSAPFPIALGGLAVLAILGIVVGRREHHPPARPADRPADAPDGSAAGVTGRSGDTPR